MDHKLASNKRTVKHSLFKLYDNWKTLNCESLTLIKSLHRVAVRKRKTKTRPTKKTIKRKKKRKNKLRKTKKIRKSRKSKIRSPRNPKRAKTRTKIRINKPMLSNTQINK